LAIADSTRLPILLHDIPARTVRELSDDTLIRLSACRQFVGLRDGSGGVSRPTRLSSRLPSHFRLLTGDDGTALAYLASGGDGCISTASNVAPELCRMIFSSCRMGRLQTASGLQKRLVPLQACLSGINVAALKYALSLLGLMRPATRL